MPRKRHEYRSQSHREVTSFNESLSSALSELKRAREGSASPWLFPRGIDFISFVLDIKNEKIELKLSGKPEARQMESEVESSPSVRAALEFARAMERIKPPKPRLDPSAPTPAPPVTDIPSSPVTNPKLKDVAAYWGACCIGKDTFDNNCAHFLSDAFIRTGFSELLPPNSCIESGARCTPASRPVRARNMWCWFQSKASKTSNTPTKKTGWWAVFQLDESQYWGGHVALLDSDSWTYYGTGWYPDWSQNLYQW
jgi:hypothetical protein